jgi:hypothetical protein
MKRKDGAGEIWGRVVKAVTEETIEVPPSMILRMMPEAVRRVPKVVNCPHKVSMWVEGMQINMDR